MAKYYETTAMDRRRLPGEPEPIDVGPVDRGGAGRMAGDVLASILSSVSPGSRFGRFVLSPRGVATGGGLAILAGIVNAANEFNNPDPTRSSLQNAAAGVSAGLGTVGGAAAGGLLGLPLGPVGVALGSTLGGMAGPPAMTALANAITGAIEGSPEQKALNQARRQAEMSLELDKRRVQEMMPLQLAAAQQAQDLRARDQLSQSLNAMLQQSSAASAAQQVALAQALLGNRGLA